jgi:4-hydroxybenzoate polyprenyltransferase
MNLKYLILSLRPKQWIKNLFIFLPLIFGGKLLDVSTILKTALAAILFSIAAGVVYLFNDIIDLEKDKVHPLKRLRPLAAGNVTKKQAGVIACILGVVALTLSFMLDAYFGWLVVVYFVFNFLYTKILKEMVIVDVFCIGGFFLLRVIAGTLIANVDFSHWMILMTVLLAMFIGFNKRRHELTMLKQKQAYHRPVLARYTTYFIDQMIAVITSSIVIAYTLYTVDARTMNVFGTKHLFYTVPFVYYGIFRYLYLVHKHGKGGDPVRLLLFDGKSQLNLALWVAVSVAVIYFGL